MLRLDLNLRQKFNISTKMIQSLEILTMPLVALDEYLNRESQENVLMEFKSKLDDPSYISSIKDKSSYSKSSQDYSSSQSDDGNVYEQVNSNIETLSDYLETQALETKLDENQAKIMNYLIQNIDSNGYLSISLAEAAKNLNVKLSLVNEVHEILTSFNPKGVGAIDLRQCLLLQVEENIILEKLISNYLEDVAANRTDIILEELDIEYDDYLDLLEELRKLNPKPGASFDAQQLYEFVVPDVFVDIKDGQIVVNMELVNKVNLNQYYLSMLEKDLDEETKNYLKEKLTRCLMIIKSVDKRNETIKKIAEYLVNYQKDYFLYGLPLHAINQQDIADELNISVSTVSRAVKDKFIQSPVGNFPMKKLFSSSIEGNIASRDYIKKVIKSMIDTENKSKPLSDESIRKNLQLMGISIKRRTVQKYREELNILSSVKRKRR